MAADDVWAQMLAEETNYADRNRHRVQGKASLASLSKMVSTVKKKPVQAVSMPVISASSTASTCLPLPSAVVRQNLLAPEDAELEPTVTLPTRSFIDGPEDEVAQRAEAENNPASFAEQLERALSSSSRDLNLLTAEQKFKRLQAVQSLEAKLLSPPLHPTVLALALPHLVKPLLKRFEDPVERVRDTAIGLLMQLLEKSADIDQVMEYVLPVTLERLRPAIDETTLKRPDQPSLAPALPPELRHSRELETSEEVRVKLLKLLRVVLVPRLNPMTSMQFLADITGCIIRGCKHAAPPVQKEACGVCIALATVLWHEHYKASILKPYTERICLGLMFALYAKSAKVRAEAVVALHRTILCGETKLVQDMAAWNPPNMLDLTQYYHPRARRNTLAKLAEDSNPSVRSNFFDMCEGICKQPYFAAEEDSRLIPYLVSGTYDILPELADKALKIIEGLGVHYENLNEKDFIDVADYQADAPYPGVTYRLPVKQRMGMGARLLVRSRVNKVLKPMCEEMLNDNNSDENRIKCAQLLAFYAMCSERMMTPDAPMLLKIALGAAGHKLLHSHLSPTLRTLGIYIEPDLYIPLCLPILRRPDMDHPEVGRLLASVVTMLEASAETEAAARKIGDTRIGGLARVAPEVLEEFVLEVAQQPYATSNNRALRSALVDALRWLVGCEGSSSCTPLLFALLQARGTCDEGDDGDDTLATLEVALSELVRAANVADLHELCLQQWSSIEAEAAERGVATLMQSPTAGWLEGLRNKLGKPAPEAAPVHHEPAFVEETQAMLEDERIKAARREKQKGGVSFGNDRTALLHDDGSIEPLLEEVEVTEVQTEEFAKSAHASDDDVDPDDMPVEGVEEEVPGNGASGKGSDFFPCSGWIGAYDGMYFGTGRRGTGYYRDADNGAAAEVAPAAPESEIAKSMLAVREALAAQGKGDELNAAEAELTKSIGGLAPSRAVQIEEDSDGDDELDPEPEPSAEDDIDPDLLPHPDDAKSRDGLAGWLDEQLSNFRVDKEYREKMVARYGSKGGHTQAMQKIVERYAKAIDSGPAPYISDGKEAYAKQISRLNKPGDGPTLADPAKIAADTLAGKGRAEKALEHERAEAMQKAEAAAERGDKAAVEQFVQKVESLDAILGRDLLPAKSAEPKAPLTAEEQVAAAEQAEQLRAAGNAACEDGDFVSAIERYSSALSALTGCTSDPEIPSIRAAKIAIHNNRAMAFLRSGKVSACVADASVVLGMEPDNPKALFRRALARRKLGGPANWTGAVSDLEALLELQPSNAAALRELALARGDARAASLSNQPRRVAVVEADSSSEEEDQQQPDPPAPSDTARRVVVVEETDSDDDNDDDDDDDDDAGLQNDAQSDPPAPNGIARRVVVVEETDSDDEVSEDELD